MSERRDEVLRLYRKLLLARRVEERIRKEYPKEQIKTAAHLGIGQEAIPIGVCHCLPPGSKAFGTYRNHALYLAMTEDTDGLFAELYGKATGPAKGKAGSMHLCAPEQGLMVTSSVVGTPIPVSVGAAFAQRYLKTSALVVTFFGDGAMEEGVFWESLNFACLRRLPIVFVCEDNGLAIHTPTAARQGFRSIPEAVSGFDCHVASGDGSDVLGVVALTRQVLARMAEQPRPGFLHLTYFRFLEHVGPGEDFHIGYRQRPPPEELERLDPVLRLQRALREQGWSEGELEAVDAGVKDQIDHSVLAAQHAPFPPAAELYTDVLAS